MHNLRMIAGVGLIAVGMAVVPISVQAQTAAAPAAPAVAENGPAGGLDAYRALAVTAGVIGGATIAVLVTDGLIIPVYAMATGGQAAGATLAGSVAAGAGAGAAEIGLAGGMAGQVGHVGYHAIRGAMTLLGAIGGGFYADSWYTGG